MKENEIFTIHILFQSLTKTITQSIFQYAILQQKLLVQFVLWNSQVMHATSSLLFWSKILLKTQKLCVVNDRTLLLTWTKHWSTLGWDRAIKDATITCSKTGENCLCTKIGFCCRCERDERALSSCCFFDNFLETSNFNPYYCQCLYS